MNQPSKLIFIISGGLADGEYELKVTTQYNGGNATLLKTPRSITQTLYIGTPPAGGGNPGGGSGPDGDENDHPLG